ncbi:SRPBCC domain-containing protein [Belliella sp. DSM 107340]|uniref:SRPBCC domain-containing protein n=1 Tax=Belliella calami TaxID=2923436 RepID=A0ABS9UMG5_9BACT|nr:SRPBCC domain-containing protein [Belliella calami]MCH7397817.1 SRPBCC domain-containing protein [Belliella calami]
MKKTDPPIVVEQTFEASISTVWTVITEVEYMKLWFFNSIKAFETKEGFETRFFVRHNKHYFLHLWKIIQVELGKSIKYNWKYGGYEGDSTVSFELFEEGKFTRLRLTVEILEDFPDHIPEFSRESCMEGWEYLIKESLFNFFELK